MSKSPLSPQHWELRCRVLGVMGQGEVFELAFWEQGGLLAVILCPGFSDPLPTNILCNKALSSSFQ